MPDDGAFMEQPGPSALDEHLRQKILADNPSTLYEF